MVYDRLMSKIVYGVFGVVAILFLVGVVVIGGCGFVIAGSVRQILQEDSDYQGLPFRIANRCTTGWWEKIFQDRVYLVLLQNNTELRSSGGFMGTYVKLEFKNSGMKPVQVEDIYQPDGQLVGHVEPPYPIQEAFGQGWWKLRDANWDPDFEVAGPAVRWFFQQGGESQVDGVVAVNFDLLSAWLGIFGQVKTETYDEIITENNLYSLAQKYAETRTFSGNTNKRDFLSVVGSALLESTKRARLEQLVGLGRLVYDNLQKKQILVWFDDKMVQDWMKQKDWTGRLDTRSGGEDYLYVVENNLGANKANGLVGRKIKQELWVEDNGVRNQITIDWQNDNPFSTPRPPVFWGGDYLVYTRVVVRKEYLVDYVRIGEQVLKRRSHEVGKQPASILVGRSEGEYDVEGRDNLQLIGFWARVPASGQAEAQVSLVGNQRFNGLLVRRQPGVENFGFQLIRNGSIVSDLIVDRDVEIKW